MSDLQPVSEEPAQRRPSRRTPPHDAVVERALLGAVLLSADARRNVAVLVTPSDFYRPFHGQVFDVVMRLHAGGGRVDPVLVADLLGREGNLPDGGAQDLLDIVAGTPATSNAARYALLVAEHAALRRVIAVAGDIAEVAYTAPSDVPAVLARFRAAVDTIALPSADPPLVWTLDDFCDAASETREWVIPLFLERGERMLLVAGEGIGKGVLLRQFAVAAGQGVNPFTLRKHQPPVRTLLVDLENPAAIIRRTVERMLLAAYRDAADTYDPGRVSIWHEPAGVDLRSPVDFARFDSVLAHTRPDLVCLGPLYKAFRKQRGESDEDAAQDMTSRFDDLRARHGFALVLEHHAPKGGGGSRELVPFGSSVWQRWPEFGPALSPHPKSRERQRLLWTDWRGPRDTRPWPTELAWGPTWPWTFMWEHGIPDVGDQLAGF